MRLDPERRLLLAAAAMSAGLATAARAQEGSAASAPSAPAAAPTAAASEPAAAPTADPNVQTREIEQCWGVNKCAGFSGCTVSKSDIEATKEVFKKKFAKTTTHDCSGDNKCSADKGQLAYVEVAKGYCLKIKGGFLIETVNGKKKVVTKA
jgi:hypothetical protein